LEINLEELHKPVLSNEVVKFLVKQDGIYIDCTIGTGGHSIELLKRSNGKVIGIDIDKTLISTIKKRFNGFGDRITFVHENFINIKKIVENLNITNVDGILFDLGLSTYHIDFSKRGFSFKHNEILDMRYDTSQLLKAEDIINKFPKEELIRIIKEYGEEKYAYKIASEIEKRREKEYISTSHQLVEIIYKCVKGRQKYHSLQRVFQAIRIAVNNELENLKKAIPQAIEILKKSGRICVISFHSLEDKIVKNLFLEYEKKGIIPSFTKSQ
jgi:16S rRNA (cytosine1402-N4)-methyltransferase